MSRLIDTDVFEKFIKEKYKDGESTDDIKDQMLFDLYYQPTAYDVDKVVEQLEDEKRIAFLALANTGDKVKDAVYDEVMAYLNTAIEIVKAGGINERD